MRTDLPVTQREFPVPDDLTTMSITDTESRIVYINKVFAEVSGYSHDELVGQPHNVVRHPDMPSGIFADMWDTLRGGHLWSGIIKNRRKDGDHYWVRVIATPITRGGKLVGYMSVRTKPAPEEIAAADRFYRRIREGTVGDLAFDRGVIVRTGLFGWTSLFKRLSVRGSVRVASVGAAAVPLCSALAVGVGGVPLAVVAAGIGLGAVLGSLVLDARIARPLARLLAQAQTVASGQAGRDINLDRVDEIGMLKRAINQSGLNLLALLGDVTTLEHTVGQPDGAGRDAARAGLAEVSPANSATHAALYGTELADTEIGRIVQAIKRMEHDLKVEKLTGVHNRTFLAEHFRVVRQKVLAQPAHERPVHALVFIDLDRFKFINDVLGHDAGDEVLVSIGARLKSAVRMTDVVARYGGDEFCVLLDNVGVASNVSVVAEKIRLALEQPIDLAEGPVQVGASIGWAVFPDDGDDLDMLVKRADLRMLEVKRNRKAEFRLDAIGSPKDEPELYGPSWSAALSAMTVALQPYLGSVVDVFFERLIQLAGSQSVICALSEPELQHLRTQVVQHLLVLTSPDLTAERHHAAALRVGRIHSIVGVGREDLVYSQSMVHAAVRRYLNESVHAKAFSVMTRRLIQELAWQAQAYQQMQIARHNVLMALTELVWKANNYTDLINRITGTLAAHDEIAGCAFGRPNSRGVVRFESIAGKKPLTEALAHLARSEDAPAIDGARSQGHGPTGRAWRSGNVEHCTNFSTDPQMRQWESTALWGNVRSMAAVPLCQPGGVPTAILTLYSAFPGGYASDEQRAFIEQVQSKLVFALSRIERLEGRIRTVPYATRQRWGDLLRSDALEMHYQPILDLATGSVTKVEALARLRDGGRLLLPGVFFPALSTEDFHVLYTRGLAQALPQMNRWRRDGVDVGVALNLPLHALGDVRYFDATQHALHEHGCPAHRLTLEILETEETAGGGDVAGELAKFKALGVGLAEDDLGSRHGSLRRLRELPFDSVKIDRKIVSLAGQDAFKVLRLIYQLTRLGHSLGKQVVVEGVEDDALLDAVAVLGVDAVQGYVVGRPMPAQQLAQWLRERNESEASEASGAPAGGSPSGTLVNLARLLLWEERLHLLFGDRYAYRKPAPVSAADLAQDSALRDFAFEHLLRELEATFPLAGGDRSVHRSLVAAAVSHGPGSDEYGRLRGQLVQALAGADVA